MSLPTTSDGTALAMNRYAQVAKTYFQQYRPNQAASMSESTFATMGDQIEQQIITLSEQLAGPDPSNESHLQKVGRLNRVLRQAEETVLQQEIFSNRPEPQVQAALEASEADPEMDQVLDDLSNLRALLDEAQENAPED